MIKAVNKSFFEQAWHLPQIIHFLSQKVGFAEIQIND